MTPSHAQNLQRGAACFAYGLVSTSMTLFNKAVFAHFHFNYPNLVTSMQLAVSIFYMLGLRGAGLVHIDRLPLQELYKVMPMTISWWLYVVSGITALRYMSVPMFSVLRRGTTPLVVAGELIFLGRTPTPRSMAAIVTMVTGAVMAGAEEVRLNLLGCFWIAICAVSTAGYLILIKLQKESLGLSPFSLLFYNNILALPMMLTYLLGASNEATAVAAYPSLQSLTFWDLEVQKRRLSVTASLSSPVFLLASVSQAFLLNLCIFWCTTANSPLATTITGQMKDILTTALGMMLFNDVSAKGQTLAGIGVGLLGGMAYSYFAYCDMITESAAKQGKAIHASAYVKQRGWGSIRRGEEMKPSTVAKSQASLLDDVESTSYEEPLIKAYIPKGAEVPSAV